MLILDLKGLSSCSHEPGFCHLIIGETYVDPFTGIEGLTKLLFSHLGQRFKAREVSFSAHLHNE